MRRRKEDGINSGIFHPLEREALKRKSAVTRDLEQIGLLTGGSSYFGDEIRSVLRQEDLLSAAILRVDTAAIATSFINQGMGPLNVQTGDLPVGVAPYNPYAAGAPLTLYATGVRNASQM